VDKLFYKQWLSGAMLIIPTVMAEQLSGIHFGNPSWAVKSGAPQGRNVHDISYCETPEHILNGSRPVGRAWLQAECTRRWGPIVLPHLHANMRMILGVVDRDLSSLDLRTCSLGRGNGPQQVEEPRGA
jgi:hypothetical protein